MGRITDFMLLSRETKNPVRITIQHYRRKEFRIRLKSGSGFYMDNRGIESFCELLDLLREIGLHPGQVVIDGDAGADSVILGVKDGNIAIPFRRDNPYLPVILRHWIKFIFGMREKGIDVSVYREKSIVSFGDYKFACDFNSAGFVYTLIELFIEGIYDEPGIDFRDKVIVDIGAFMGDSSVLFAMKGAKKVVSYEPLPDNFEYVKTNVNLNSLAGVITIHNKGISGKTEKVRLEYSDEGKNTASGIARPERGRVNTVEIECVSLDDVFLENGLDKIDILKMDCEGSEYPAIIEAKTGTLARIGMIYMEYHLPHPKYTIGDLTGALEANNFKIIRQDEPSGPASLMGGIIIAKRQ